MRNIAHQSLHLLRQWRAENDEVAATATAINLGRARLLCLVVAALNAAHALVFYSAWASSPARTNAARWAWALLLAHASMGLLMVLAALLAYRWRHASQTRWGHVLPVLIVALAMAFAIAVVSIDQWITPNITPFLITCLISGLVIYLRPAVALGLYLSAYAGYFWGIGVTQDNPALLLSNRANGIAACVMGQALSVLLWRKFTLITRQHVQLEQANAALQHQQKALERLSRIDGLTGLYNRSTFTEMARRELDRAQRTGANTTILLMDLDFFKRINDTWGHPAGDAVLQQVAQLTARSVRSSDLVGRLGGEEFMVLLPDTGAAEACALAEKLCTRLEHAPTAWEGGRIAATVSIGVASTSNTEQHNFEHLYQAADKALYLAKAQGRNRVACTFEAPRPADRA